MKVCLVGLNIGNCSCGYPRRNHRLHLKVLLITSKTSGPTYSISSNKQMVIHPPPPPRLLTWHLLHTQHICSGLGPGGPPWYHLTPSEQVWPWNPLYHTGGDWTITHLVTYYIMSLRLFWQRFPLPLPLVPPKLRHNRWQSGHKSIIPTSHTTWPLHRHFLWKFKG